MSDLIIAKLTGPDEGWVSVFPFKMAVQCQRVDGEWKPLFGIKVGIGKVDLPPCFELREELAAALDDIANPA